MTTATAETSTSKQLEDYAEYREAFDKVQQMRTRRDDIEQQIVAVHSESRPDRNVERTALAEQLLGGDETALTKSPMLLESRQEKVGELTRQRRVCEEAIRLAERCLDDTRTRIGRQIVEAVKPAYGEAVREMLSAGRDLVAAANKTSMFHNLCKSQGISDHFLGTVYWPGLGGDPDQMLAGFHHNAVAAGHVGADE